MVELKAQIEKDFKNLEILYDNDMEYVKVYGYFLKNLGINPEKGIDLLRRLSTLTINFNSKYTGKSTKSRDSQ